MNIYHLFNRANRTLDAQENRLNEIQQHFNNMSTIHTALTGKSDSLIDAVRDMGNRRPHDWRTCSPQSAEAVANGYVSPNQHVVDGLMAHEDRWSITIDNAYIFPKFANTVETDLHPDHPDYMRMVVHQMD